MLNNIIVEQELLFLAVCWRTATTVFPSTGVSSVEFNAHDHKTERIAHESTQSQHGEVSTRNDPGN
jgi:hypothetical protein